MRGLTGVAGLLGLSTLASLGMDGWAGPGPAAALGGHARFLTAVSTDKPLYRPGERVLVRGVMLHAFTHAPATGSPAAAVQVRGPKGDLVTAASAATQEGTWSLAWDIPAEQPGGEYTVRVSYPWTGDPPAERSFDIRAYRAPRLKSQIVFLRDGYGPGDTVTATLETSRAEGGIPTGAAVTAVATLDGQEVARVPGTLSDKGRCTVRFDLPKEIARGEGTLALAVEDGGVVETAAKTIPILLRTVDLQVYPEAGDLVEGVSQRVYFQARTPAHKPADLAGVVLDAAGKEVASFRSGHDGRGRLDLRVQKGARYSLKITEPAGVSARYPLPEPRPGVTLRTLQDVVERGARVQVEVQSSRSRQLRVSVSRREDQVASTTANVKAGTPLSLSLDAGDAEGVLTVTAWDPQGRPVAERLVYRRPRHPLEISLAADKSRYVPGDSVQLTVRTRVDGKPVPAVVGLTVSDDAVLEMVDKRDQAPLLPVMVLLEPEVQELADAHVYLDDNNPKAPLAVDLLLGTQGWRRFALQDVAAFLKDHGDAGRRALAQRQPQAPAPRSRFNFDDDTIVGDLVKPDGEFLEARRGPQPQVPEMAPMHAAPPPEAAPAPAQEAIAAPAVADKFVGGLEMQDRGGPPGRMAGKRAEWAGDASQVVVREFAHQVRPNRQPADRLDFAETLYWHAGVATDDKRGEATVRFALNDSVTTFKASAGGYTRTGSLGSSTLTLESVQPFYLEPKLPLEVTTGDVIQLPVALVNGTTATLKGVTLQAQARGDVKVSAASPLDLAAGERGRRILELSVGKAPGTTEVALSAHAGPYGDNVMRSMSVKPAGFPVELAFGGVTTVDGSVSHKLRIPANVAPGSLRTSIGVYPTPLANMTESLERLIQEPYGCFEQTSSTSYPLTMAQQYFTTHSNVDPALVKRAQETLEKGYQRLTGFECSEKGYEWFGENPGHEALTAYGLMHFTDMAQVRAVDPVMLERSRTWLLGQRDGKGGFTRKRRALHTWIEDPDCSNGYILWALLETGQQGLEKEVAAFKQAAATSTNSYVLALGANVLALAQDPAGARSLMDRLVSKQVKTGMVDGATTSIVGSGGEALEIETTALAALAWMRNPAFAGPVEGALRYLADSCKSGRYGSTQSTVLALRAIVTYDKARARPKAAGTVLVRVDGKPVGSVLGFDQDTQGALRLPDITAALTPGDHEIALEMRGGSPMPYSVAVSFHALTPSSSGECKLALETRLTRSSLPEGEPAELRALVTNRSKDAVPTPVAILGLPGGLEPRHDQLKELVKKGTIDAYEVIGRDVVLYWRALEGGKQVEVPVSVVAAVPGSYTGPASRAYLYYTDEHKTWVDGLQVRITPRK